MRSFLAFCKKEWLESLRTYKFWILLAVFLLFGMMSPATAKWTPELLKNFGIDAAAFGLAEPSAKDAWMQFFKNVGQMGLVVLVIVYGGLTANELSSTSLVIPLAKGLRRRTVLCAKMLFAVLLWTLSYLLSLFVCLGYTAYFFPQPVYSHLFLSFSSLWLYGVLLLAFLLLGGILFRSVMGSLLFTGGFFVATALLRLVSALDRYNPIMLTAAGLPLLFGDATPADLLPALFIAIGLLVALFALAVWRFDQTEL